MAFSYYSPLSINSAQVPSTQTNFPVLVSVTDARFKTVANSGHVQNASGFDIRPYSDSGLTTAITGYELERYNASTGEVVMWVKVASLSSSTTPIYLAYGDAGISTDGSSSTTWSNGFLAVYHLKDGTTLSVSDSVGSFNGTNHSATATAGQIDGGTAVASASTQYISAGDVKAAAMTMTCWAKGTSFPNPYNTTWCSNNNAISQYFVLYVKSNGKLACFVFATNDRSYDGTGSHTLSTGTWYHLAMSYSSSAGLVGYVNGASDGTQTANGVIGTAGTAHTAIGANDNSASVINYWNGALDEVRISNVVRSADWITTEYNNTSAPGTFETLGSEVPLAVAATGNFFLFF